MSDKGVIYAGQMLPSAAATDDEMAAPWVYSHLAGGYEARDATFGIALALFDDAHIYDIAGRAVWHKDHKTAAVVVETRHGIALSCYIAYRYALKGGQWFSFS